MLESKTNIPADCDSPRKHPQCCLCKTDWPISIRFKANFDNTGPITVNGEVVRIKNNGNPLMAGEIKRGDIVEFDPKTGEWVHV